jgi:predicted porin
MDHRKLAVAVAVAGAFAFPAAALAQTSVSISGYIKMAMENVKLGNFTRAGNSSENRVVDENSRVIFNMVEDLGGGVQAFAQLDWRVTPDVGTDTLTGNNWIGLRSKSWGQFFFGRSDLHYNNSTSEISTKASYKGQVIALLTYAGGGNVAIANDTRTPNVYKYDSPTWGGFKVAAAYSTNPAGVEADIASTVRRGLAYNVVPTFTAQNWMVGYSYWRSKSDAFVVPDQRGDRVWGYFLWGGLKLGLNYDKSKLTNAAGVVTSNRTAWSPTLRYSTAPHNFFLEYAKANNDKATAASDGAYMISAGYAYDLSKRTAIGISYATVKNDSGAFYNVYGGSAGYASANAAPLPGEDPRVWSLSIKHAF